MLLRGWDGGGVFGYWLLVFFPGGEIDGVAFGLTVIFGIFFIPETQYNRADIERRALAAAQLHTPGSRAESQAEANPESQTDIPEKEGSNISTAEANGIDLTIVESQTEPEKSYLQSLAFYDKSYDSGESFLT